LTEVTGGVGDGVEKIGQGNVIGGVSSTLGGVGKGVYGLGRGVWGGISGTNAKTREPVEEDTE
jgi:hypothetical protein